MKYMLWFIRVCVIVMWMAHANFLIVQGQVTLSDPTSLAVHSGRYDAELIQRAINDHAIERLELSSTRERLRSFRIEIAELRPGPGRAHLTIFSEVVTTFAVDPNETTNGFRRVIAVELRRASLDQFGTPVGTHAQKLSLMRSADNNGNDNWSMEQTEDVALTEFPDSLSAINRRVLFLITGLLRAAPGQPVVPWQSEVTDEFVRRLASSLLGFVLPEFKAIPIIIKEVAEEAATNAFSEWAVARFKSRELKWGAAEILTEPSISDFGILYDTLGRRVWTDPRGFQPGCTDQPGDWISAAGRILAIHRACLVRNPPLPVSCTQSIGQFAGDVFSVNDFYKPTSPAEMNPNEILALVSSSPNWENLGNASNLSVRERAQELANKGMAVLGIRRGDPTQTDAEKQNTKIAFILPGELKASGSWGGDVPNSATLATANAAQSASYVGMSLAFAFSNGTGVQLYARKF